MPLVSVVMPTYNRADTIERAINSVINQSLRDWELIVVDDGSTDNTAELILQRYAHEPRVKLIRQQNQGFAGARNTGLRIGQGKYIAFLDSDDEFFPYHLELLSSFLEAHPAENFVTSELWEDLGNGRIVKHYQVEVSDWFPKVAAQIGSRHLDLSPGESDNYLRVYQTREPIGDWGRNITSRIPHENVYLYRGRIFDKMRWGFLMCMQSTMITRRCLTEIGEFDVGLYAGPDFGYAAELCRHYTANYISAPVCIKHELAPDGQLTKESHVATGETSDIMNKDLIYYLEKLYCDQRPDDLELKRLLGWRQYNYACHAISRGQRDEAINYLNQARRNYPALSQATALYYAVRMIPQVVLLQKAYNTSYKFSYLLGQIRRKEIAISNLAQKVVRRFSVAMRLSLAISLQCVDFASILDSLPMLA